MNMNISFCVHSGNLHRVLCILLQVCSQPTQFESSGLFYSDYFLQKDFQHQQHDGCQTWLAHSTIKLAMFVSWLVLRGGLPPADATKHLFSFWPLQCSLNPSSWCFLWHLAGAWRNIAATVLVKYVAANVSNSYLMDSIWVRCLVSKMLTK